MISRDIAVGGHERVVSFADADAGYRAIVAIHDTTLGPALGGTRLLPYSSDEVALAEVLRLAEGMSYKAALAGVPTGGGKSVIIGSPSVAQRRELFRAHGRAVESLGGAYITSVDIGTSPDDMEFVRETTSHVLGLHDRSGDPSPSTARGVLRAMQAVLQFRRGSDALAGVRVAIQGCGNVGSSLARQLSAHGAVLVICDIDAARAEWLASKLGAAVCDVDDVYGADVDIFSPCARGAVLGDASIPVLRAWAVAGGANNQLERADHDDMLRERGILYAPDYAANAGGLIHLTREFAAASAEEAAARVEQIFATILGVLETAAREGVGTQAAANRLARMYKLERTRPRS